MLYYRYVLAGSFTNLSLTTARSFTAGRGSIHPHHDGARHPVAQVDAQQVATHPQPLRVPVVAILPAGRIVGEQDPRGAGDVGNALVHGTGVQAVDLGVAEARLRVGDAG